ncbi:hypothetical protein ACP275_08G060600 [Erythranthe tilingii]
MDLELLEKGIIAYAKKKKKWVLVLGALGFTSYASYRIYNSPSVIEKRQRLTKLTTAFFAVAETVSYSADAIGILSRDFKEFLGSDSDQIPQSLKQLSKIARSNEFSESLTKITSASTAGNLQGYHHHNEFNKSGPGLSDRVVDKLFSDSGSGFASVIVGSFARNLAMGLVNEWQNNNRGSDSDSLPNSKSWVDFVCEDNCRELIGDCIRLLVSTAVGVYLDKTMNINTYDEILSALMNPKNEAKAKDMLVSVCNGAVETLIRTSHQEWTTNSNPKSNSNYSKIDFEDGFSAKSKKSTNREIGWVRNVSKTLAVPSNRRLVLDMTGKVTFETVRSFMEFVLDKFSECTRRSVDVVHQEVVDKGVEAIRHVSDKSVTVATLCLTLCLNILNSPWILATAPY